MIGVDMGINHKTDPRPGLGGHAKVWSDVVDWVGNGAGGVAATAEQVGDCHRVLVQELAQDHQNLPQERGRRA
jgi:hypothetical protein